MSIQEIHKSGKKIALAVTGGGAEVIGELLRHGGGSNTIVEAIVTYAQTSFDAFVGGKPDKYCSESAARDLAMAAFNRLCELNAGNREQFIGLGATCSLTKSEERVGRKHYAYVAIQTVNYTRTYTIDLSTENRTREEEEKFVADHIIGILYQECCFLRNCTYTETSGDSGLLDVILGQSPFVNVTGTNVNLENRIVFPGSFNPMHQQHKNIAEFVSQKMGRTVDLEICVHNVDKPSLNFTSLAERKDSILSNVGEWTGDIFFTSLPTFLRKSNYFKNSTFIVGWDTFVRIIDPKYADLKDVYEAFEQNNSRFLVFHRIINGVDSRKFNVEIPSQMLLRTEFMDFPSVDMSSSQIRKG